MKVCHLTSVHTRYDTRIFLKECSSLATNGHEVSLIVADDLGDELKGGVKIHDVGKNNSGRLSRFTKTTRNVFRKAIGIDADVYHFHDPELMPFAYLLKLKGKKVIYDAHEDLPRQLLSKPYLGKVSKKILSFLIEKIENFFASRFTAIITATPFIRDRFLKLNNHTIDINNFPIISEFEDFSEHPKKDEICYVGGLSQVRGILEVVKSLDNLNSIQFNLAGLFNDANYEKKVKSQPSWSKVNELGFIDREGIKNVYSKSKIGIVTLHPIVNYLDSLPVKMFEYMASGLPVIASDISLWKSIIDESKCGICVNPLSPNDIAKAIDEMIQDPKALKTMGVNGRKAIVQKYNWSIEENKLLNLYGNL